MWQLYYFPLCPFSRKVRLALSEKGVGFELRRETPWDASEAFYSYNPAGRTPVLRLEEKNLTLIDSQAICEYFEETVDKSPLILGTAAGRAEIRRLTALFDESFFADVTHPLMHEKMKKRTVLRQPPDSKALRAAKTMAGEDPEYVDPDLRVGDLVDPETADAPYEFAHRLPQMMGALATAAATLETMLPELRAMGDRIAEDMAGDWSREAYEY